MDSVNLKLLDEALARIDANPDEWEQVRWRCETAMCLAGHVAHAAGATWVAPYDSDGGWLAVTVDDGQTKAMVGDFARDALGLRPAQADALFSATNTREGLQAMRDLLAESPGARYFDLQRAADRAVSLAKHAPDPAVLADTDPQRSPRGWQEVSP
jgi:hypothetical protein